MIVNPIQRRPTRKIRVGSVYVGGDAVRRGKMVEGLERKEQLGAGGKCS